ncbi:YetF domain-containing protein [Cytobacillus pseudoceanisediminis]|uniref:YetF domain-containing protein n=1 Tax=Cytobacillus pseudoceanisediminis TaxID=3051614 RepID=UPI003C2C4B96
MTVNETILRVTISFLVLFLLARLMGRKEIGQMTFFNWASAIGIGSIAGNLAVNESTLIKDGVISLIVWTLFTILMDMLDLKSKQGRTVTTGEPLIVIKAGRIMERALKISRVDLDELQALLRQKDIFSLNDVDYAILETNGDLSVLKKESQQPVTKNDLNIMSPNKDLIPLPTEVIADGKVNSKNLSKLKLDNNWLDRELQKAKIYSAEDVFFAQVQQDGTLYIDRKNK